MTVPPSSLRCMSAITSFPKSGGFQRALHFTGAAPSAYSAATDAAPMPSIARKPAAVLVTALETTGGVPVRARLGSILRRDSTSIPCVKFILGAMRSRERVFRGHSHLGVGAPTLDRSDALAVTLRLSGSGQEAARLRLGSGGGGHRISFPRLSARRGIERPRREQPREGARLASATVGNVRPKPPF